MLGCLSLPCDIFLGPTDTFIVLLLFWHESMLLSCEMLAHSRTVLAVIRLFASCVGTASLSLQCCSCHALVWHILASHWQRLDDNFFPLGFLFGTCYINRHWLYTSLTATYLFVCMISLVAFIFVVLQLFDNVVVNFGISDILCWNIFSLKGPKKYFSQKCSSS